MSSRRWRITWRLEEALLAVALWVTGVAWVPWLVVVGLAHFSLMLPMWLVEKLHPGTVVLRGGPDEGMFASVLVTQRWAVHVDFRDIEWPRAVCLAKNGSLPMAKGIGLGPLKVLWTIGDAQDDNEEA